MRSEDDLIECKYTDNKSYSLKRDYLKSLFDKADSEGRRGVMLVDIDGLSVVVMSEADWTA